MSSKYSGSIARYRVEFAQAEDVVTAQRLRYRVFAEEFGAQLCGGEDGIDRDRYDPYCRHLLVRDLTDGTLAACTRILTDAAATSAGGFYSHNEFDLGNVLEGVGRHAEIGRTCVASRYRNGAVIATLWQGIGQLVHLEGIDCLFGCASVSLRPQPEMAYAILRQLAAKHLAASGRRVVPRRPLPATTSGVKDYVPRMPPLLRAYLRLGAKVCGEAHWDPDFDSADVFVMLDLRELEPRYERHFVTFPVLQRNCFAGA